MSINTHSITLYNDVISPSKNKYCTVHYTARRKTTRCSDK